MTSNTTSLIREGITDVFVYTNKTSSRGPGLKGKEPFYNPAMALNRDFSILVNQWLLHNSQNHVVLLDGLAASGIRGVRFSKELDGDFEVTINDADTAAYRLIKKNIKYNCCKNATASNENLNVLLSEQKFHSIDIDPFGSPVYFIDAAVRSVHDRGIIACTATDTATLSGVYPFVCLRRYAAQSFHSYLMHEVGLRILLGCICREAAKYDKGINPIVSYTTDHYFRVYVQIRKGKRYANDAMKQYTHISSEKHFGLSGEKSTPIGPLWMGKLQQKKNLQSMRSLIFKRTLTTKHSLWKLISLLEEEAGAPSFFYTSDTLASQLKRPSPKMEVILGELIDRGFTAVKTHFNPMGFKTDASFDIVKDIFQKHRSKI